MDRGVSDQASTVSHADAPPHARAPFGEKANFRAFFDENASYVSASLGRLGIAPSDREDLVVEVFVRVHRELARYDESRPLRPWLFAFAARVASEHRRLARHRREILGDGRETASTDALPDRAIESAQARQLVGRALDVLDDDKRAVFVLHDLDETPIPEIARVLAIPEGTAYSRLRTARAEFTQAIRRLQAEEKRRS